MLDPMIQRTKRRNVMGFMDEAEKLAGAAVAVEAARKLDPNAGIFTEGAAAFAGYKGAEAIEDHVEKKDDDAS
jgi:hypothetical protein